MEAFEELVVEALDDLPSFVQEQMDNVAVVVEERPLPEQARAMGFHPHQDLLGLYEGTSRLHRAAGYHLAVPDRISIYRQPILQTVGAGGRDAIRDEVRRTVIHEVAHHFGFDDPELEELEGIQRVRPSHRH